MHILDLVVAGNSKKDTREFPHDEPEPVVEEEDEDLVDMNDLRLRKAHTHPSTDKNSGNTEDDLLSEAAVAEYNAWVGTLETYYAYLCLYCLT